MSKLIDATNSSAWLAYENKSSKSASSNMNEHHDEVLHDHCYLVVVTTIGPQQFEGLLQSCPG
jgi:hypothetical protein